MLEQVRVQADQFVKVMATGRTSPLLLICESVDGHRIEVVAKFAHGRECNIRSLCSEWIAACLARDLGLQSPDSVLVNWQPSFAHSVLDTTARRIMVESSPPAFGSTYLKHGYSIWPPGNSITSPEIRKAALAIFFFDGVIGNPDRRLQKPNLLYSGSRMVVIDHEMAFCDDRLIAPPPPPWSTGGFRIAAGIDAHLFAAQLRDVDQAEFDPLRAAWMGITDMRIASYLATLPNEWLSEREFLAGVSKRICEARKQLDACIKECKRALRDGS